MSDIIRKIRLATIPFKEDNNAPIPFKEEATDPLKMQEAVKGPTTNRKYADEISSLPHISELSNTQNNNSSMLTEKDLYKPDRPRMSKTGEPKGKEGTPILNALAAITRAYAKTKRLAYQQGTGGWSWLGSSNLAHDPHPSELLQHAREEEYRKVFGRDPQQHKSHFEYFNQKRNIQNSGYTEDEKNEMLGKLDKEHNQSPVHRIRSVNQNRSTNNNSEEDNFDLNSDEANQTFGGKK
jgi:hypothetical protein